MGAENSGSRLRVLHLITDLGKGGAERFLLDLCRAHLDRGDLECVVGVLYDNDQYSHLTGTLPVVRLHHAPFSFRRRPDYAEYRRLLEDFRPHVVHTHRFLAEFLSGQHVREEAAYVCHCHDNMVQFENLRPGTLVSRQRLSQWLEKRYLVLAKYRRVRTAFVANSTHTEAYYRKVLPRKMRADVHLIPCGFDYGRFGARRAAPPREGEPLRLVNVGSFVDKKNQMFILDIARELREAGVDFRIDLLGDGPNRGRVQEAVDRRGLGERISLHGNVDLVEEWLWRSHVYLHTARYEPFGLALLEAMAAGLPCVALDGKGNRDILDEGKNGYLLETEAAAEFASRIKRLAASPDTYRSMSDHARASSKEYDIGDAADRFVDFYRRILRERAGRP